MKSIVLLVAITLLGLSAKAQEFEELRVKNNNATQTIWVKLYGAATIGACSAPYSVITKWIACHHSVVTNHCFTLADLAGTSCIPPAGSVTNWQKAQFRYTSGVCGFTMPVGPSAWTTTCGTHRSKGLTSVPGNCVPAPTPQKVRFIVR